MLTGLQGESEQFFSGAKTFSQELAGIHQLAYAIMDVCCIHGRDL